MKLKMKKIIPFLSFVLGFCFILGVGYTTAKYAGIYDAGEFFLSLTLGGGGEVDPGEAYTLYYHTFDENGADVVYKTETVYENLPVTIEAAPEAHSDLTFVGWSPQGVWISDEDIVHSEDGTVEPKYPLIRILYRMGQNVVSGKEMLFTAVSTTEIHLYDLYQEYSIVVQGETSNAADIGLSLCIGKSSSDSDRLFKIGYSRRDKHSLTGTSSGTYPSEFIWGIEGKTKTHYVHPSLTVKLTASFFADTTSEKDDDGDYEYQYRTQFKIDGASSYLTNKTWTMGLEQTGVSVRCVRSANSNYDEPSSSCIAAGTLITMADGSKLPVEQVQTGDMVRVFDHENGCYTSAPVLFTEYDGDAEWNVINLEFSDGTFQKFIYEHGLFDLDLNRYVYITEENYQDFIGHRFAKEETFGYSETTLINAYTQLEFTGCYSLTTEYHLNVFVNGMFSMPGGIIGLFNFFEYDENLAYERELMAKDIETYGLFTYEEFAPYMSEETFNSIFPIKYLKVSVGKGLTSFEGLEYIIERYIYGHNLDR